MRKAPEVVGIIHFTGIGGIGMSGIAEILNAEGYQVQGSNLSENSNVLRLQSKGIKIFSNGQHPDNIKNVSVLVVSTAIKNDNPELLAAKKMGIPVVHRAEMLAEIMRMHPSIAISGSHGKTTTTSIMSHIMDVAGYDPTIVNGGIIQSLGTNAKLGSGEWLVAEADESDGSFIKLPATIGIVTNIDKEHMDHYKSFDAVKEAFKTFIENLPFYGLGIVCWDNKESKNLAESTNKRRIITYGESEGSDVKITNIKLDKEISSFTINFNDLAKKNLSTEKNECSFELSMVGRHNVLNAVSTIIASKQIGISFEDIKKALSTFQGVARRFTKVGKVNGVTIIDDYAHHPEEIKKTLEAARLTTDGNIIAIIQPHRYSRLNDLMDDFAKSLELADIVYVTPVFCAGEKPIEGADSKSLVMKINKKNAKVVYSFDEIVDNLKKAKQNDIAIFMGAGSITDWAYESYNVLKNYFNN